MPKKPKISKDAFDWIKDTSKEAEEALAPEPELPKPEKKKIPKAARPVAAATKEISALAAVRTLFIRYKENGDIVGLIEVLKGEKSTMHPYANVPAGENVVQIGLADELIKKELIEIHTGYRVDISGTIPRLITRSE